MTGWLGKGFVAAVLVFLAAPLVVVCGVSVNTPKRLLFPPEGFSLRWYGELFVRSDWAGALTNSVLIAVLAGLLAVCVALPLALYIWSHGGLRGRALFGLGIAPFMLPPVVSALGFMVFWIAAGLYGHILATVVSHAVFLVALPLVTISLGLGGVDRSLLEAARTMGASRRIVFLTVILPLIRPYVISGFAFACEPELYGPTANPWDRTRTPGGSSGGAAAAVASGMVPMAHATDSGGSIRVPAGCCGVFGFKPSSGLVATGSEYGPLVGGLNCDHAVTWTVRDSAALLDATAGPEVGAPIPYARPPGSFLAALDRPVGELRIGVATVSPSGRAPAGDIAAGVEATASLLADLGHSVRPWTWPVSDDACDAATVFWVGELAAAVVDRARAIGRAPRDEELGPLVARCVAEAGGWDSIRVMQARRTMREWQIRMARSMTDVDVLLTPVTAEPPLATGLHAECMEQGIEVWNQRSWRFAPYTETFNVTGQPAMSVPLHQGADGLPVGVHFAGRVGEDARLLRLARQLEEAAPWIGRRPPDPS